MSLLGKILAILNFFGALGLVYVASIDYGKRQAWAYSYYRYNLAIEGLPVDEQENDDDSVPRALRISEDDRKTIFGNVGGNPVATQVQEVERLKQALDTKIQALAQNKPQQTYLLARILLPLTDAYLEREQLQACRAHLANDALAQALKARCQKSLQESLRPGPAGLPERPFSESFRVIFRAQQGDPAELFVSTLLRYIPDDRARAGGANFDQAWDNALEAQRAGMIQRYNNLFAEATGQSAESSQAGKKPGLDAQRAAIARLLFGLCPFLAEDAIFTDTSRDAERKALTAAPTMTAYQQILIGSSSFTQAVNRMLVVCGLRASVASISERASAVRRLGEYATNLLTQERQQFVYDHAAFIELLREQATLVRAEFSLINENKERLASQETIVNERKKEIATLEGDLKTSRTETAAEAKKLRGLSQQVLELRQSIRDAVAATEKGEVQIRELEKQVRDLDRRGRD